MESNDFGMRLNPNEPEADNQLNSSRKRVPTANLVAFILLVIFFAETRIYAQSVPTNSLENAEHYRKSAESGDPVAESNLGSCYAIGIGVQKDDAEAASWWLKAAEQGNAEAQYNLGIYYESKKALPKKNAEAVKWYRKAAEQGFALAQSTLGDCYREGKGVPVDHAEAVKWYRKAAEQGNATAQYNLGVCYTNGDGVPKDNYAAVKWYFKASEQGVAEAQWNLGVCFYGGTGIAKNAIEAYKWWLLAGAQSHKQAKSFIAVIEQQMTREQIAEGQRLARIFKPRIEKAATIPNPGSEGSETLPKATGTGFFITDSGFLITNKHVVEDASQVRLATSAGIISAKVVKVDGGNDLALLKAEGRFAALPLTASRLVKLGASVATIGFPNIGLQGFAPKLSKGEIASLSGPSDDARYFQISVPVQPGNSGGALVDERGNVVGVVSAKLNAAAALAASGALPENVNYAVKSSFLLGFLESLPDVASELKEPKNQEEKFEDAVKSAQLATVLILVY